MDLRSLPQALHLLSPVTACGPSKSIGKQTRAGGPSWQLRDHVVNLVPKGGVPALLTTKLHSVRLHTFDNWASSAGMFELFKMPEIRRRLDELKIRGVCRPKVARPRSAIPPIRRPDPQGRLTSIFRTFRFRMCSMRLSGATAMGPGCTPRSNVMERRHLRSMGGQTDSASAPSSEWTWRLAVFFLPGEGSTASLGCLFIC
jgi:hypothetical protein